VLNPSESETSSIKVITEFNDEAVGTEETALKATFKNDIEYVQELTITIVSKENIPTERPVKLSILACVQNTTIRIGTPQTQSELLFPSK
jgi:hypothetical protein